MEEITLKSQSSPLGNVIYTTTVAALACAVVYEVSKNSLAAIFPALIGVSIFLAWRSEQGKRQLGIDDYGLTIRNSQLDVNVIPWPEIEKIVLADVESSDRGIDSYRGQYIGIRLASFCSLRASIQCSDNRRLSTYDFVFCDYFGMPLKDLEAFLREASRKAQGG